MTKVQLTKVSLKRKSSIVNLSSNSSKRTRILASNKARKNSSPFGVTASTGVAVLEEEAKEEVLEVPATNLSLLNLVQSNDAVGGRLFEFRQAWREDRWSYRIVSQGLHWTWHCCPPQLRPPSLGQKNTPLIQEYVEEMLEKEAIEPSVGKAYVSRIFPVAKKGTTRKRMILDLSILNKFIVRPSFKMTTVNQVRQVVPDWSWMATIDLKDAYWHIPIHSRFRKYLAFQVERNT